MASAKAPPRPRRAIPAGVAGVGVAARYFHPQPGAIVLGAGAKAEEELAARLPDTTTPARTELVVVAVSAGELGEAMARIRSALG